MKDEINKILEMLKNGVLSSEQATQLIQALGESSKKAEEKINKAKESFGDFISERIQGTLSAVKNSGIFNEDPEHNSITLSKFNAPSGSEFVFSDNSINLSSFAGLELLSSKFVDNSVNASKLEQVEFKNSDFIDNGIHASSFDHVKSEDSKWINTQINGTKVIGLELKSGSSLTDCQFNASSLKNTVFENVQLSDTQFNACNFSRVTLRNVDLKDIQLNRLDLSDCEFNSTEDFKAAAKI